MFRVVKLSFPNMQPWHEIVIGPRILIGALKVKGFQWGIIGLGLRHFERVLFGTRFLHVGSIVNIYLGKLIVSYNKAGYHDHIKLCAVHYDVPLSMWLRIYCGMIWWLNVSRVTYTIRNKWRQL